MFTCGSNEAGSIMVEAMNGREGVGRLRFIGDIMEVLLNTWRGVRGNPAILLTGIKMELKY